MCGLYGGRSHAPGRAPAAPRARRRRVAAFCAAAACALAIGQPAAQPAPAAGEARVAPFSAGAAGGALPAPWTPFRISERKTPTQYRLVDDAGTVVLHAHAERAASGLAQPVTGSAEALPYVNWRWKIAAPLAEADPEVAAREDAPARVILEFDGDHAKLPLRDRTVDQVSERLSGRPLPYATLMYIHATRLAVGTVVPNPHTRRVQMIVVASGDTAVGAWQAVSRNWRDDFRRAFGEAPGPLLAVGVLTDTDNTGETADAWYGDIRLAAKP